MKHHGSKRIAVVLALLLMAAGAGLVWFAFRASGGEIGKEAQSSAAVPELPEAAAEPETDRVLLPGWDGQYSLSADGLSLILEKRLLPEENSLQPDFSALFEELCYEAVDASFSTDGSHTILPEKSGRTFDPEGAQRLWEQSPEGEVHIPLQTVQPQVISAMLESLLYRDLLGAVTTKYNNSGESRCINLHLASAKIDGYVLFPGEEFSFNTVVGPRTEEAGFLPAPAYAGYDNIKEEIGGGVCQVSTGVYAASLFAFLEIKSHTSHIYPPNYIQLGTDATVTIPEGGGRSIDLKVINSKSYPVKIVSYCEETVRENGRPLRTVTVEIWGTLEDDDYMPIEFDNSYIDIYDYDRVIPPAYPDREGYKIKFTHEESEFEDETGKGLHTLTHRKVYDSAGTLVEDKIVNPTYSAGYALDTYYYRG